MNTHSPNHLVRALLRGALCALILTPCVAASAGAVYQGTSYQAAPAGRVPLGLRDTAPGSLLFFPEYGNSNAAVTIITVTNVHPSQSIRVVWAYVRGTDCAEFTTQHLLTPYDTLSVIPQAHSPLQGSGYLKIYAADEAFRPVAFNHLIGASLYYEGTPPGSYSLEAVAFRSQQAPGSLTDVNLDGRMDLDGLEYARAAKTLVFPRFIGTNSSRRSSLILANLSGGFEQDVTVDIQLHNDNGYAYNAQLSFQCWRRMPLETINSMFTQAFLSNTPNTSFEPLGMSSLEGGWFQVTALHASAPGLFLPDPAILAFLVEGTSTEGAADLPFGIGKTATGSLSTGLSALEPGLGLQRGR